jgi:hypothetical protein
MELPVFPKKRFQEGATPDGVFSERFSAGDASYRQHFLELYEQ